MAADEDTANVAIIREFWAAPSVMQRSDGKVDRWWHYLDLGTLLNAAPPWWHEHIAAGYK